MCTTRALTFWAGLVDAFLRLDSKRNRTSWKKSIQPLETKKNKWSDPVPHLFIKTATGESWPRHHWFKCSWECHWRVQRNSQTTDDDGDNQLPFLCPFLPFEADRPRLSLQRFPGCPPPHPITACEGRRNSGPAVVLRDYFLLRNAHNSTVLMV